MTQCLLLPYMPAFFVTSGHKMTALMTVFRDFQTSDLSKPDHIDEKIALSLFVILLKSIGLVILLRIAFTVVQLLFPGPGLFPRSGELRTRKLKSHLGENTELKRSPFKACSRSVYSHTCYAYCQGFRPFLFLPSPSIHLHFFPKPLPIFSCVGCG